MTIFKFNIEDEALKLKLEESSGDEEKKAEEQKSKENVDIVQLEDADDYVKENAGTSSEAKKGFRDYIQLESGGMIL